MYASSVSNSLRTKQPMVLCHDDVTENSMAFWLIAFEGEILIFKIINPCVRTGRINMWTLFYGEFLSQRCKKNKSFKKGSVGICSTPQGPLADFICLWNTSAGLGQREGPRFGHQRCFPWQWDVFSVELFLCRLSKGSGYSRNRKVLQTIWQHTASADAAAAERCCQERIYTTDSVCLFVITEHT